MSLKNLYLSCLCIFSVLGLPLPTLADDLEPRRWSHLPIGMNNVGVAYARTEADIGFDPALQIENVEMEMDSWALAYLRSFELFQKSARIQLIQGYQDGRWTGLLEGVPTSADRSGLSDSLLRFAINLYGAPPLAGEEFAAYRAKGGSKTIVGAGLVVQLPTGDYMDDKLINLGTNRYTFRPQLGVVHSWGAWSFENTGTVSLFTDNNDFFNGNKLEQDPLYSIQTHLVYSVGRRIWVSAGAAYEVGGESTVSGVEKDDEKENVYWALGVGCPITRQVAAKIAYIGSRTQESTGRDTDSIAVAFSYAW
jgi:hypothetical protein